MNKNELIDFIATKTTADLSKTQLTQIVDLVFEGISAELKNGGEVRFAGFGSFKTARREASTGRNPRTGETIQIAAQTRVKFTPGKDLKETVNG